MSSGSYFPPPVRAVSIPKKSGGERILGVPTVAERVAQMVVKQLIEPDLHPIFLADFGCARSSSWSALSHLSLRCRSRKLFHESRIRENCTSGLCGGRRQALHWAPPPTRQLRSRRTKLGNRLRSRRSQGRGPRGMR